MVKQNIASSVRARLKSAAQKRGIPFQLALTQYGLERFLFRLGESDESENFYLKGAMLFNLWYDIPTRPTLDIDLLGHGDSNQDYLIQAFQETCEIECPEDGLVFDLSSVKASEIRKESGYTGVRVTLLAKLENARIPVQIDIGYGDAVTPKATKSEYPSFLSDLPPPVINAYPKYTVVAEKFEAICSLGMQNSRLKDYFDIWILAKYDEFDGSILVEAIKATLTRRGTAIPSSAPIGITDEFSQNPQKKTQWNAFLRKNNLASDDLDDAVHFIQGFILPVCLAASKAQGFNKDWSQCEWID